MKIGYIKKRHIETKDGFKEKYELNVWTYTRKITEDGDCINSKGLYNSYDYAEVEDNTELIKNNNVMFIMEPFFVDDEGVLQKAEKWVENANKREDGKEQELFSFESAVLDIQEYLKKNNADPYTKVVIDIDGAHVYVDTAFYPAKRKSERS